MATNPTFLKIINGDVVQYNFAAQPINHYSGYPKGQAVRVDWFDKTNESIEVLTKSGKVYIISKACQIIKII